MHFVVTALISCIILIGFEQWTQRYSTWKVVAASNWKFIQQHDNKPKHTVIHKKKLSSVEKNNEFCSRWFDPIEAWLQHQEVNLGSHKTLKQTTCPSWLERPTVPVKYWNSKRIYAVLKAKKGDNKCWLDLACWCVLHFVWNKKTILGSIFKSIITVLLVTINFTHYFIWRPHIWCC